MVAGDHPWLPRVAGPPWCLSLSGLGWGSEDGGVDVSGDELSGSCVGSHHRERLAVRVQCLDYTADLFHQAATLAATPDPSSTKA